MPNLLERIQKVRTNLKIFKIRLLKPVKKFQAQRDKNAHEHQNARERRMCDQKSSYEIVEPHVDEWSSEPMRVKDHFNKIAETYIRVSGRVQRMRQILLILTRIVLIGFPLAVVIAFMVMSGSSSAALQLGLVITTMLVFSRLPGNGAAFSSIIGVLYLIGISFFGYFILINSGISTFPIVTDVQKIDARDSIILLFTYASITTLATLTIVAILYRVRHKTNAWLMRPCPREELIFLSIEVAQAVDQELDRIENDGWGCKIVEKLTRIGRLLETCEFLPIRDMDRRERRFSIKRFAELSRDIAALKIKVWLPDVKSSQEIRVEAARLAAAILLRYYGELFRERSDDRIKWRLRVVALLPPGRTLLIATIPYVALLATSLVFKAVGFRPNEDLITSSMLVVSGWMALILVRHVDPSVGEQFGRIVGFFSQLWNSHTGSEKEKKGKVEKGEKYEEGEGGRDQ